MQKKIAYLSSIPFILFCIDRFTKWVALSRLDGGSFFGIPGFFGFELSWNRDILFFFPLSQPVQGLLLSLVLFFFSGWVFHTLRNKNIFFNRELLFFQSSIGVGAVSNIYDRLTYGAVIDWITIGSIGAFNMADMFIVGGIFGSAFLYLSKRY